MKPKVIESKLIYEGKIFDVLITKISEANVTYDREIVIHNGSAVVVPMFDDGTIALVKQYRHAAGKYTLELPAGSIEKGETSEECAIRELKEEVGVKAGRLEKLTEFFVSPGFLTEKMFVYIATRLEHIGQNLEHDELLEVKRFRLPEILRMIIEGEIEDAKTIIGVFVTALKLGFCVLSQGENPSSREEMKK